ncbi:MAG: response regulator transcription factor [Burkholderiales bacterium]|nr:response regulator transcription factor [Burkholderiales bacterium]
MPHPHPTALIADDEDLPRAELRRMLAKAWPALEIVAECEHGPAAVEALAEHSPDVAFLDIRMPGSSGLEVAHAAHAAHAAAHAAHAAAGRCHVVFTTAHDTHAIAAFEAGAVDYLLKPIAAERLAQAVARVQERLASRVAAPDLGSLVEQISARLRSEAGAAATSPARLRWVSASVGDTIKLFGIDEVLFFQSDEKYTRVVTERDEAHVRKPLKEIADGLDPEVFWQVHRGTVVRASEITRAVRDELGRFTLHLKRHKETLAVSQAWAWRFRPM